VVRRRLFPDSLAGPLLLSAGLHALVLLALVLRPRPAAPQEPPAPAWAQPRSGQPVEVAVLPPLPRLATRETDAAPAGGGRPPGARARRGTARAVALAPRAAAPATATLALAETAADEAEVAVPIGSPSAPDLPAPGDAGAPAQDTPGGDGEGHGSGDGTGDGTGSGTGEGAGDGLENLGKELHARILGDVSVALPRDEQQRAVLTHDQATPLRQRDIFPRLPESLWPAWRPYVVTLRVCVDEQGQVSDATLLSSAAPRLDGMVAAAARSWRYRPFEAGGRAAAFCHGVVIQYEHW